jgi:hypothetical protein
MCMSAVWGEVLADQRVTFSVLWNRVGYVVPCQPLDHPCPVCSSWIKQLCYQTRLFHNLNLSLIVLCSSTSTHCFGLTVSALKISVVCPSLLCKYGRMVELLTVYRDKWRSVTLLPWCLCVSNRCNSCFLGSKWSLNCITKAEGIMYGECVLAKKLFLGPCCPTLNFVFLRCVWLRLIHQQAQCDRYMYIAINQKRTGLLS